MSVQNGRQRSYVLGRFLLLKYFWIFSFSQNLTRKSHDLRPVLLFIYPALFPLKPISSPKMSALILCTSLKDAGIDTCFLPFVSVQNPVQKSDMSFGLLCYLNILGSLFSVQKPVFSRHDLRLFLFSTYLDFFLPKYLHSRHTIWLFLLSNNRLSFSSSRTERQLCLAFVLCAS